MAHSPSYAWTLLDGTPLAAVGNTLTIDPNTTNPTDEIVCTASATDNDGLPFPPPHRLLFKIQRQVLMDLVSHLVANVEANTTLEMVLSVSDLDNDTLSIQYTWLSGSGQNLGTGSTLTLNNSYAVGSTITAIATLTDAYGASDTQSGVITIDNTDPQVLTPATINATPSPVTGGQLTCGAAFTDFNDGGNNNLHVDQWFWYNRHRLFIHYRCQ